MLEINDLDFFLAYDSHYMYSDGPSIIFHLFGVIAIIRLG